jgi:uncharacterized protein YgiB involved in biofilm formation
MRSRRSTATLTLVLIGAAALHGCGNKEEETARRDVYKSRADCQRDWGEDDKKCEQATSGSHAGMFYGPLLYGLASGMGGRGTSFAPRPGSSAVASTQTTTSHSSSSVSRGGFGSSASSHSSGG